MSVSTEAILQPPSVKLALYAGDGVSIKLVVDNIMGERLSLYGQVIAQIRASRADSDPAQIFNVDLTGVNSGQVILSLSGGQTAALAAGGDFVGVWDVEFTSPAGQPVTLVQGKCMVMRDVTRP